MLETARVDGFGEGREMDDSVPSRELVVELLQRLRPDATLAAFLACPADHYTMRIELPDEPGKTLIIARQTVERAFSNPLAYRSLEQLLQSAVLLRPESERGADRAVVAGTPRATPAWTCGVCGRSISRQDRIAVRRGRLVHAGCAPSEGASPPA